VKPLLDLGSFTIPAYGMLLALAIIVSVAVGLVRSRRFGVPPGRFADLMLFVVVGALLGAKLTLFLITYDASRSVGAQILAVARAGGVLFGGLAGALLVFIGYTRKYDLPTWSVVDAAAPGMALAQSIIRMGCLMSGCCYGRPADVPWAIVFDSPLSKLKWNTPQWTPLHPTQIYEALAAIVIAGVLLATEKLGRYFPGRTFWTYMILTATARLILEPFRGHPRGTVLGALSTAQAMMLVLIPISAAMLLALRTRVLPKE
jgi:phosphatidylglycerol:prolipoprotein diacylglycerol transferase